MSSTESTQLNGIELDLLEVVPLLNKRLIRMAEVRECLDMPLSHMQVLSALAREGDMSVTEISKRFGIAKPNITPLIDHLTDAGWVERTKNNRDRRVVNVTILPEGREKVERALEAMRERVAKWKNGLTEEEFIELQQALKSVVRILGKL